LHEIVWIKVKPDSMIMKFSPVEINVKHAHKENASDFNTYTSPASDTPDECY